MLGPPSQIVTIESTSLKRRHTVSSGPGEKKPEQTEMNSSSYISHLLACSCSLEPEVTVPCASSLYRALSQLNAPLTGSFATGTREHRKSDCPLPYTGLSLRSQGRHFSSFSFVSTWLRVTCMFYGGVIICHRHSTFLLDNKIIYQLEKANFCF